MRTTPRLVMVVGGTAAAVLAAGSAAPAVAASPPYVDQWKAGQTVALVSWVEEDHEDVTGRPGTVHIGGLLLESWNGSTNVSAGSLADWDCPPGVLPSSQKCTFLAQHEVADGDVQLELDPRAGTAQVAGLVTFYDLAGLEDDVWTVPVNLTWTTEGKPVHSGSIVIELSSALKMVSHQHTLTWSSIRAAGTVGSLVLGDEPGELNEERLWHDEKRFFIWTRPGDDDGDGNGGTG